MVHKIQQEAVRMELPFINQTRGRHVDEPQKG
jgi:hypothetical protein